MPPGEILQILTDAEIVREYLVDLWDKCQFQSLSNLGSLAIFCHGKDRAVPYFYAALGLTGIGLTELAKFLMHASGQRAEDDQIREGLQTITDMATKADWAPELIDPLLAALSAGYDSAKSGS
jgi:hypothetical protein